jgi:elongation factor Ts
MVITASAVKELREKTGVGMMECKKALVESNGNIEAAIKFLREKGLAKASKKAERTTAEGRVFTALSKDNKKAYMIEIACETDFVAKNASFIDLGNALVQELLDQSIPSLEGLNSMQIDNTSFEQYLANMVLKLGENIQIKSLKIFEAEQVFSYVHLTGKIGVLVGFDQQIDRPLGQDIAMHIAAAAPLYLNASLVPDEEIQKEKDIIKTQLANEGKPAQIIDKITEGKISKYFKEICLLDQVFVKDTNLTIKQLLENKANITDFLRLSF